MIPSEIFLKYLSKGFSVFPVNGEKRPLVDWKDYQNRYATEDEINAWCALLEPEGIGMATGKLSGVLVVDIDDPEKTYGFDSPVQIKTQSGGRHMWYKWQPGIRNTVRIDGKPIDVRGDGGYVVLPPTRGIKGKYEWLKHDFDKMPNFPDIKTEEQYKPALTELPNASEGHRNNTAIQVAGHIIANTKEKAWETVAWTAFRQWNNELCEPPLTERELRMTFDSCCTMQKRKHPNEEPLANIYYGQDLDLHYQKIANKWGSGLTTSYPILDNYFKFLPEHLYLISAPTHQGKTTLALNFAAKIASFGSNVLFCSLEQGVYITPMIKTILGGPIPATLGMMESDNFLSTEYLIDSVAKLSKTPDLIVIDHLHFMKKDISKGVTAGLDQMIGDVQIAAKKMSLPILVIAHLRKLNDTKAPTLDDLRDSSYLAQIPSVIMLMKMDEDNNGNTKDSGTIFLRKNRISQKKDAFSYKILPNGDVDISANVNTNYKIGEL